ncbi:hypothetical protein Halhy_4096 [Haliscomenobacter hydrossis DSM 1100]|uniref:Uncharacterized protein n=1 Tax=Haliscomenobacter hydrossis (strain ATCC 27775 / DSM 1100 / LMG 10767 / O) TaxID=760192 RepID=F4L6Y9_HALH1|nr:hypothetical protein Halhy_4096 [Haliscomenobacter hydrossis DSM 1100]
MDIFCADLDKNGCRGNPGWLPYTRFFYHDANSDKNQLHFPQTELNLEMFN